MAGRSSSLLTAKMVLLIASAKTDAGRFTDEAFSTTGIFGKSSPFSPLSLYLPSPALISMAKVVSSTEKVTGCSGSDFKVSSKMRDGIAMRPFYFASKVKEVVMLVCKSVAEMVKFPSFISNKKFSSMGSTVLLLNAPLTDCNCLSNVDVETINLI
jgi:hypothetical protein